MSHDAERRAYLVGGTHFSSVFACYGSKQQRGLLRELAEAHWKCVELSCYLANTYSQGCIPWRSYVELAQRHNQERFKILAALRVCTDDAE